MQVAGSNRLQRSRDLLQHFFVVQVFEFWGNVLSRVEMQGVSWHEKHESSMNLIRNSTKMAWLSIISKECREFLPSINIINKYTDSKKIDWTMLLWSDISTKIIILFRKFTTAWKPRAPRNWRTGPETQVIPRISVHRFIFSDFSLTEDKKSSCFEFS